MLSRSCALSGRCGGLVTVLDGFLGASHYGEQVRLSKGTSTSPFANIKCGLGYEGGSTEP